MATRAPRSLNKAELEIQRSRGKLFRRYVVEACQDFLDDMGRENHDKIGIFLSGGVDSTTLLWDLLKLGIRPSVYTMTTPLTKGMSTDHKKAKALADFYRLPFKAVQMPDDPDVLAHLVEDLFVRYIENWAPTRPDKEVPPLFYSMMQEAKKDGIRYVYSGIGEVNLHNVGRKSEIRGRAGEIGGFEMTIYQLNAGTSQLHGLSQMFVDNGMRLCLPHSIAIPRGAYHNVPWKIINTPRSKSITMSAYESEVKESDVNPIVMSMQNGDSGARQYYDALITSSKYVTEVCGKELNTATPYYNVLQQRHAPIEESDWSPATERNKFAWIGHVNEGAPLSEEAKEEHSLFIDLEKSEAFSPVIQLVDDDEDDLFGVEFEQLNFDEEIVNKEPDGTYSKNVDCFGRPLWMEGSLNQCETAKKGFCSSYNPSVKRDVSDCEAYSRGKAYNAEYLEGLGDIFSKANNAYTRAFIKTSKLLNGPEEPQGK